MALLLVVDDDPDTRETLSRLLEHAGHQVIQARDGREGLRHLRSEPVDLLLTDVVMPELDGLGLIQQVRQEMPALPIIAFSGGGLGKAEDYLKVARLFGVAATLAKPYSAEEVLEAVAEVLAKPK